MSKSKKIAVILNGCGNRDGSEIHEAVFTLEAISALGADAQCFSLDETSQAVINHATGETSPTPDRNMLVESARIARGKIKPLEDFYIDEFQGLIIPGGFGTAMNLCNFAKVGASMEIHPLVANILTQFKEANKPIGCLCIAPILLGKHFGIIAPKITSGSDEQVDSIFRKWGAIPQACDVTKCCVDREHKFVTSPAYMYDNAKISDVRIGIFTLVEQVLKLAQE